jgi:hypothetical protein
MLGLQKRGLTTANRSLATALSESALAPSLLNQQHCRRSKLNVEKRSILKAIDTAWLVWPAVVRFRQAQRLRMEAENLQREHLAGEVREREAYETDQARQALEAEEKAQEKRFDSTANSKPVSF